MSGPRIELGFTGPQPAVLTTILSQLYNKVVIGNYYFVNFLSCNELFLIIYVFT